MTAPQGRSVQPAATSALIAPNHFCPNCSKFQCHAHNHNVFFFKKSPIEYQGSLLSKAHIENRCGSVPFPNLVCLAIPRREGLYLGWRSSFVTVHLGKVPRDSVFKTSRSGLPIVLSECMSQANCSTEASADTCKHLSMHCSSLIGVMGKP